MSGISTSSSDSHEFILVPTPPAASTLVQVGSTSPGSPPRTHRRLVKRSHAPSASDDSSPPPTPSTPPAPPFSSSHARRGSASPGRGGGTGSSPRERSPPIIAPHESLVGDVQMSRTRVIISKTHTIYDPAGVPFRSALIGFRATFHSPPAASARVRDAEVTLKFWSCQGQTPPIIKAIAPTSMGVGPSTSVTDTQSVTAGLHLGYTTGGTLELSRTASKSFTHETQARISSSGVETNELWLTLKEDGTSRQGIPSTVDFASLIMLTSEPPFEAELSVGVTIGRGPQALLKMLSSPQEWIALYDGTTTLNPLRLSTPTASRFIRPTGMVSPSTSATEPDVEMVEEEGQGAGGGIRAVKRKPSTLEC